MSKSLGNTISPTELVNRYGKDGARYLLLSLGSLGDDSDASWERFDQIYTAHLANGIGNLCSRVAKLCSTLRNTDFSSNEQLELNSNFKQLLNNFDITEALRWIAEETSSLDRQLSQDQPWKKTGQEQEALLLGYVEKIRRLAFHLSLFIPEIAERVITHFGQAKIKEIPPLFPRIEESPYFNLQIPSKESPHESPK